MHRYLTKLSDQVICLMSKEHSEAVILGEDQDEKPASSEKKKSVAHNRLYTFAVQKTKEQEESVSMHDGFKVCAGCNRVVPVLRSCKIEQLAIPMLGEFSHAAENAHLLPRIVPGEMRQAIISGVHVEERVVEQNIRRPATKVALSGQLRYVLRLSFPLCFTDAKLIIS
jgi:hypothetical protein